MPPTAASSQLTISRVHGLIVHTDRSESGHDNECDDPQPVREHLHSPSEEQLHHGSNDPLCAACSGPSDATVIVMDSPP